VKGNLRAMFNAFALRKLDSTIAALTEARSRLGEVELGAVGLQKRVDEMVANVRLLVRIRWVTHTLVPVVLFILGTQGLRLVSPQRVFTTTGEYLMSLWPNLILASTGLAVNGVYFWLIRKGKSLRPIAHAQVWLDIGLFSLMIYTTGGIGSPFAFLYVLPILAASMLLSFRLSVAAATLATAVLGFQAWLQMHHVVNERYFEPLKPVLESRGYVIATVILNGVLYFLIAIASGVLSRTIHRHEARLAKRANEATMLYEVSSSLQSAVHLDEVLDKIMNILVVRLDIDRALMYLMNEAGDGLDLKVVAFHPRFADRPRDDLRVHFPLKREGGLTAICAIEKQAFNVTDPLNHPHINRELAARIGLNPFALAPMMARQTVIGVIGIDRKFRNQIITQEEAQTLGIAANQSGLTIQECRLYEASLHT
jgi:K+-sensing histidine kinase KdpD